MGLRSGRTLQPSVPSQETTAGPVPRKKTKVVPPILHFDQVQRQYEQEREEDLKRQYPPKITPAATSPTPAPVVPQRQAWSATIRAQVNRLLRKDPTKLSTPEQFEAVQQRRTVVDQEIIEIARSFDSAVMPVVNGARISLIGGSSDLSYNLEDRITNLVVEDVAGLRTMLETLAATNLVIGQMSAAASAPGRSTQRTARRPVAASSVAALSK